ncbi:MAG TPA: peptide-methionine (S)-S-oxide reductase MsrA [Chthoniobacterales bacterium]|nr:peptide-methionine (S)-S-oxide reductase MsrA [Chthoniobacterales bacterium]
MTKFVLSLFALMTVAASAADPAATNLRKAVFAGGCFWCMQPPYDNATGVVKTIVGYTGGNADDATYEKVSAHRTQHREAIEVTYDPARISYDQLLDIFWRNINPTQADGQFHDIGLSYQAAIFYGTDDEKKAAEESKEKLGKSGKFSKPVVTEILPAKPFYPAEEYHQKYYLKNAADFEAYHVGSGRVSFLEKIWGREPKK